MTIAITITIAAESVVLALLAQAHYYHLSTIIAYEMIGVCVMAIIMPYIQTIAAKLVAADKVSLIMSRQKVSGCTSGILGPAMSGCVIAASRVASALWLHVALLLAAAFSATRLPKVMSACACASPAPDDRRGAMCIRAACGRFDYGASGDGRCVFHAAHFAIDDTVCRRNAPLAGNARRVSCSGHIDPYPSISDIINARAGDCRDCIAWRSTM